MSTTHVIYLSTNVSGCCEHCSESIDAENIAKNINHYISAHNYKLLHVGQETIESNQGTPWHTTVAVLANDLESPL